MKIIIISMLAFAHLSYAAVLSSTITGAVVRFDSTSVVILQNGQKFLVPKKFFTGKQIKVGEAATSIDISLDDLNSIKKVQ